MKTYSPLGGSIEITFLDALFITIAISLVVSIILLIRWVSKE